MIKPIVTIEPHSGIDKRFDFHVNDVFSAKVDYDYVNHLEVDAAAEYLKELIEKCWVEDRFQEIYRAKVEKEWDDNVCGIQKDYESKEEYMSDHGFSL